MSFGNLTVPCVKEEIAATKGCSTRNAVSEDRAHDLRIMRPTRYQLRYDRLDLKTTPNHISVSGGGGRFDTHPIKGVLLVVVVATAGRF